VVATTVADINLYNFRVSYLVATHKFMVAKAFYHNYEKFYFVGVINRKVAMINHKVAAINRKVGEAENEVGEAEEVVAITG